MPSAQEARPTHCSRCGVASRPVGQGLNLHGHGQRERQVRGPRQVGGRPVVLLLRLRRYLCRCCKATLTVGPMGLWARRLFDVAALGLGLCLWGVHRQSMTQVYQQVNPWERTQECRGWRQLGRWARQIQQGRLFAGLCPGSMPLSPKAAAERAAAAMAARCPPDLLTQPMWQQVFAGAALAV